MAKHFEKSIFGGQHEKHAVQRGIWVPTQHSLWDQGKPRKILIELAARRLDQDFPWFSLGWGKRERERRKLGVVVRETTVLEGGVIGT
jgi:hypothetical protein